MHRLFTVYSIGELESQHQERVRASRRRLVPAWLRCSAVWLPTCHSTCLDGILAWSVALRRIKIGESVEFQGWNMAGIEKHISGASFDVLGTGHRKGLTVTILNLVLHLKIFI